MNKPLDNPIVEFAQAMHAHGLDASNIIDDGKIHKCKCSHDKGSKTSGRYYLHSDGAANGQFGCYHDHDNALGCEWASEYTDTRTEAQKAAARAQYAIQAAARETQILSEQADTAAKCIELWGKGHDATTHDYLTTKGVHSFGLKVLNGALLVPLYDGKPTPDNLVNIQFIQADGTKRFKTGGKKQGCYFSFGSLDSKTVVVCEGYSTGASIAQAAGHRVVVAFDAGNLIPVAQRIASTLPDGWRMVIAADNDAYGAEGASNTGVIKATAAAQAVGAFLAVPCFDDLDVTGKPTDFNDLMALAGKAAVNGQFEACLMGEVLGVVEAENLVKPDVGDVAVQAIEETDEAFIKRLAGMSALERARQSKGASERLGITVGQLNGIVKAEQAKHANKGEAGTSMLFADVEPFDAPVDGAEVLNEVYDALRAHVIADIETLHAATLWVCMTWLVDCCTVLPLAVITAPEKGCGKTTLLTAMGRMVCKPLSSSSISPAALFRTIEAHQPTLLLDETDATFKANEELRGIVNSGHTRDNAFVMRTVGEEFEPKMFSTWCAKALSGIGHMPETIESRAIILKMRRKVKGESVRNIRHTPAATFDGIKRRLARWSIDNAGAFSQLAPIMDGMNNRDADNYEPLLAIAMLAGDEWVKRIKIAARVLTATDNDNRSIGVELLDACRTVFGKNQTPRIHSGVLLSEILQDEESPFLHYNRGAPYTLKQMSKKLADYGIRSKSLRVHGVNAKGFEFEQFNDAFSIYLDGEGVLSVTSSQPSTGAGLGVTILNYEAPLKTNIVTPKPSTGVGCDDVTILEGVNSENSFFEGKSDDVVDKNSEPPTPPSPPPIELYDHAPLSKSEPKIEPLTNPEGLTYGNEAAEIEAYKHAFDSIEVLSTVPSNEVNL